MTSWDDPTNPDDPQAGYGYIPNDTTKEETFFYHSDHLGSTSYITDDKANITQYDAYLPYGELLVDEHSSSEELRISSMANSSMRKQACTIMVQGAHIQCFLMVIQFIKVYF